MLKVVRVVGATLNTMDIDKMIAHYTELLGLRLVERADNGNAYISLGLDHHNLVLSPSSVSGLKTMSYEINTDYSLKEVAEYFKINGIWADLKTDAEHGIPELVEISDPDNNRIHLFPESKRIGIGYKDKGIVPQKLGHITTNVKNAKKTVGFYEKYLGFKVSDWMADFFCFMRCSSDHHNMNFMQNQSSKKMNHIAFELKDVGHIVASTDYLAKNGKPLIWGPVRHGIGHNIATYHYDAEENVVELFAEMDVMNEEMGYFEPRPYHEDFPQRPKVWNNVPQAASQWGIMPPEELTK
jgi:catechol 2,3-dioxygenase-like lactoylglutathione lyase family enzyme